MRLAIGLLIVIVGLGIAAHRLWWLYRLSQTGQPAPDRLHSQGARVQAEVTEVVGQRKLLKWTLPGWAHAFTFWGFCVLSLTIVECFAALFTPDFAIPLIGRTAWLAFLEDFFGVAVFVAILIFAAIRWKNAPARLGRDSRFYKSHTGAAWVVLLLIGLVIVTLFGYRGPQINNGNFPMQDHKSWAFASNAAAKLIGTGAHNGWLETFFVLAQLAVVFGFLVLVVYSKHLHIFSGPLNVYFSRRPKALGPAQPMMSRGKPIDFEDPGEDDIFGRGKIEDASWKAMLDFYACTECGRCQTQCPAWNTNKPLSPKLLITNQRDHLFAKAPYLFAGGENAPEEKTAGLSDAVKAEVERPLVGKEDEGGVIDPDVLWACTTCGACVEQCPVDIEHVDHIIDMRRYQVLIESAFPSEAGIMLKNIENKGNPWGMNASSRNDWMEGLPFEVRVVEDGVPDDVEYLFWVGCAGALEDRSKKVTKAFAELLHTAGVSFAVLGEGESCTGDPARRLGNEFLFQMQGQMNVEVLNEAFGDRPVKKIVATCPHCFNTLAKEYPQIGGNYEVVHHTQLLGRLVAEGKLTPVTAVEEKVTYHDPCYLGRHNNVYTPPREVLSAIPGLRSEEMHRCKSRGFCCGAGGARMWMEERIGKMINVERTEEALGLDPDMVSTACPFCMVMIADAVQAKQQTGAAKEGVEVLDVAQILARSLVPAKVDSMAGAMAGGGGAAGVITADAVHESAGPQLSDPAATATADHVQPAPSSTAASSDATGAAESREPREPREPRFPREPGAAVADGSTADPGSKPGAPPTTGGSTSGSGDRPGATPL